MIPCFLTPLQTWILTINHGMYDAMRVDIFISYVYMNV